MDLRIFTFFVLVLCVLSISAFHTPECNNSACNTRSDCDEDQSCSKSGECETCTACCDKNLPSGDTCASVCGSLENDGCANLNAYDPGPECLNDTERARSSCDLVEEVRLAFEHSEEPYERCFNEYIATRGGDYVCKPKAFSEAVSACKAMDWRICQVKMSLPLGSVSVYQCFAQSCAGAVERVFAGIPHARTSIDCETDWTGVGLAWWEILLIIVAVLTFVAFGAFLFHRFSKKKMSHTAT